MVQSGLKLAGLGPELLVEVSESGREISIAGKGVIVRAKVPPCSRALATADGVKLNVECLDQIKQVASGSGLSDALGSKEQHDLS